MRPNIETEFQGVLEKLLDKWTEQQGVAYEQYRPHTSQQGAGSGQYAGDLVGLLGNSRLLLLELKVRNGAGRLQAWDAKQYAMYCKLEPTLPVRYAYPAVPNLLLLHMRKEPAANLLAQVLQSPPSGLGTNPSIPDAHSHDSLLDHLQNLMARDGSTALETFGVAAANLVAGSHLTNGVVLLLLSLDRIVGFEAEALVAYLRTAHAARQAKQRDNQPQTPLTHDIAPNDVEALLNGFRRGLDELPNADVAARIRRDVLDDDAPTDTPSSMDGGPGPHKPDRPAVSPPPRRRSPTPGTSS